MIPVPGGVRVWLATGATDMRRGMNTLALQVQEDLGHDPHAGDLYIFRGRRGDLVKCLWHDGVGISLYAKRLERGRFLWPTTSGGAVSISAAQLGYLLEGIDWRKGAIDSSAMHLLAMAQSSFRSRSAAFSPGPKQCRAKCRATAPIMALRRCARAAEAPSVGKRIRGPAARRSGPYSRNGPML